MVATDDLASTPDPSGSLVPAQVGRYRILERLDAGGMGTVYMAHDPQLNRIVAVKLPQFEGSPHAVASRRQRFLREARAAAQVWHPHVCPLYDVGEHDGHPYVVMAYVEGQSLSKRLAERGRYEDVGEAVALIRQVLDALEAVHAHRIIHRDIKPGNILIDKQGRAILGDFGLARLEDNAEQITSDGVVVGTPAYMAPEQAAGQSERIGPWTDLYCLGVVLFQMLTGRLPFEGPPLTVLARILHEEPPPPSGLRSDIAPALEALVLTSMSRDPQSRFQSARQFNQALGDASLIPLRGAVGTDLPATEAREPVADVPKQIMSLPQQPPTESAGPLGNKQGFRWLARLRLGFTGLQICACLLGVAAGLVPNFIYTTPFWGLNFSDQRNGSMRVDFVFPNSPAEDVGFQVGDIIGAQNSSYHALRRKLRRLRSGNNDLLFVSRPNGNVRFPITVVGEEPQLAAIVYTNFWNPFAGAVFLAIGFFVFTTARLKPAPSWRSILLTLLGLGLAIGFASAPLLASPSRWDFLLLSRLPKEYCEESFFDRGLLGIAASLLLTVFAAGEIRQRLSNRKSVVPSVPVDARGESDTPRQVLR